MFTTLLVTVSGLLAFVYITIVYWPKMYFLEEQDAVKEARKAIKKVASAILWGTGATMEVQYKNKEEIEEIDKKRGIVYISNHQSNIDIPAILLALDGKVGFVAKKEMKKWPFYGFWMAKMKCVFLDRKNPKEGLRDIKQAVKVVKEGYPTLIFPEGERSSTGEIGTFKKGSFKLAIDTKGVIIPITVKGTYAIQKRGELSMHRGKHITVIIDEPIYIDNYDREQLKTLDQKVRDIICSNFYDDKQ